MARTETFYNMGFRLTYPDVFDHPRGLLSPMEIGDMGDGIYFMMYTYIAVTEEDIKAMRDKSGTGELSQADSLKLADAMGTVLQVAGIGGGQGPKELAEKLKIAKDSGDTFTEVGKYKDITYYAITNPDNDEKYMKAIGPVFAEELRVLQASLINVLKNAEYIGPQIPGEKLVGKTIRFETKDINGNSVKSEDLFSAHEVTMINIWATWCGPCKKELEELGNIHRRLETKNAAVIGICLDADEEGIPEEAKEILKEAGVEYLNLVPPEGVENLLPTICYPTSFLFDSEGRLILDPIRGAHIDEYRPALDKALAQTGADVKGPDGKEL